jgi:hypothetical protein
MAGTVQDCNMPDPRDHGAVGTLSKRFECIVPRTAFQARQAHLYQLVVRQGQDGLCDHRLRKTRLAHKNYRPQRMRETLEVTTLFFAYLFQSAIVQGGAERHRSTAVQPTNAALMAQRILKQSVLPSSEGFQTVQSGRVQTRSPEPHLLASALRMV